MTLFLAITYFFIYGFLGWCTEVIYSAATKGKFINRGFLNGSICPIYGVGVVMVAFILEPFKDNLGLLFIFSVIVTTSIELLTGWVLEKFFHTKWWDYSDVPFNIAGYVCPKFSLIWGIACLFVIKVVHPLIVALVELIPEGITYVFTNTLVVVITLDFAITMTALLKIPSRSKLLKAIDERLDSSSDFIGKKLAYSTFSTVELVEKSKKYLGRNDFVVNRLMKAFPNLQESNFAQLRGKLKKQIFSDKIVTLTLNPAIDYCVEAKDFELGKLNRVEETSISAGGKGINVSMMLNELGTESVACGFTAGFTGGKIKSTLDKLGIKHEFVEITEGETRINVKLHTFDEGKLVETEMNAEGPKITKAMYEKLEKKLKHVSFGDYLVISGSTLKFCNEENAIEDGGKIYGLIAKNAKEREARLIFDVPGKYYPEFLKYKPFLIKPNASELDEAVDAIEKSISEYMNKDKELDEAEKQRIEAGMKVAAKIERLRHVERIKADVDFNEIDCSLEVGQSKLYDAYESRMKYVKYCVELLLRCGAQNVLCSLGKDGAILGYLNENKEVVFLEGKAYDGEVVQTLCAGDSMLAGFLHSYFKDNDVAKAFNWAMACGSASAFCEKIPTKEEVEKLLKSRNLEECIV
ncbi:MAG: PfkB family carbohydrate kinase [Lachnospiraceae bacterium]|nr:PfkB family carbohydrate kinase [Lachnospiraceae bacterium]